MMKDIVKKIKEIYQADCLDVTIFRDETTMIVSKKKIKEICQTLKELGFDYCIDMVGIDTMREKERFEIVYNLLNIGQNLRVHIKIRIDESYCEVSSVTDVWQSANWHEREVFDMIGVKFINHPDLRRMYMPEDFEYYPLRKDFPLIGVPGSIPMPTIDVRVKNTTPSENYNLGKQI